MLFVWKNMIAAIVFNIELIYFKTIAYQPLLTLSVLRIINYIMFLNFHESCLNFSFL